MFLIHSDVKAFKSRECMFQLINHGAGYVVIKDPSNCMGGIHVLYLTVGSPCGADSMQFLLKSSVNNSGVVNLGRGGSHFDLPSCEQKPPLSVSNQNIRNTGYILAVQKLQ